jgi:hypothetical protein
MQADFAEVGLFVLGQSNSGEPCPMRSIEGYAKLVISFVING